MIYYPPTFPGEKIDLLKKLFLYLKKQKIESKEELTSYIRKFLKKEKIKDFFPKFWHLNFLYHRFFQKEKIGRNFLKILKVVPVRSLSGIIPLSVFTSPLNSCPFNCVYCPKVEGVPRSYFPDEAAVMRAVRSDFDPFCQTLDRLVQFYLSGHSINKVEVIIQGGTFSFYPSSYRRWFVQRIFDCLNSDIEKMIKTGKTDFEESKDLFEAKSKNKKAKSRMVGLTIETRPDFINQKEILFLRELGVTRVELGVQTTCEETLKLVNRGHGIREIVEATKLLRDCGFKITYHIMPGLPGSDFETDLKVLREIFTDERFKPDNIKLYPTCVVKNSQLALWYQEGKFNPIDEEYLLKLTERFKKEIVPPWVRINRLVRDLTRNDLVVETFPSNFRQKLEKYLKAKGIRCPCIRCREIREGEIKGEIKLNVISYSASQGKEFFIEAVDNEYQLLGYLRLRIPSFVLKRERFFIKTLENTSIIRELHVLGEVASFSSCGYIQHKGLGRRLVEKAIEITCDFGLKRIAVISAVGTRLYYKKLGFKLENEGEYMVKEI